MPILPSAPASAGEPSPLTATPLTARHCWLAAGLSCSAAMHATAWHDVAPAETPLTLPIPRHPERRTEVESPAGPTCTTCQQPPQQPPCNACKHCHDMWSPPLRLPLVFSVRWHHPAAVKCCEWWPRRAAPRQRRCSARHSARWRTTPRSATCTST